MDDTSRLFTGSCLCRQVRYHIEGSPKAFYHCHCSRCRKATGTGHASNLFVQGRLHWDSGEKQIRHYKVPEAERFANSFCANCGGRLPQGIPARDLVMIPAGSLEEEPRFAPQARIFQGSRTDWSCTDAPLECFENYPH